MFSIIKKNNGIALPMVLIAMVLLFIFGVILVNLSSAEVRHAIIYENNIQAKYAAYSGADDIANKLIQDKSDINLPAINSINNFNNVNGVNYQLIAIDDSIAGIDVGYDITVRGTARDRTQDVTVTVIKEEAPQIFANAVYANNSINITSIEINNGNVQSGGSIVFIPPQIPENPHQFNGTPIPDTPMELAYSQLPVIEPVDDSNGVILPDNGDLIAAGETISISGHYDSIIIKNSTLTIDTTGYSAYEYDDLDNTITGGHPLILTVDSLTIDQAGGFLEIVGGGALELNVHELIINGNIEISDGVNVVLSINSKPDTGTPSDFGHMSLQTPLAVNYHLEDGEYVGDPNQLLIFLDEGSTLDLQANAIIWGYIFGPEANVRMHSASSTVNGAIIGDVVFGQNNEQNPSGVVNYIIPDSDLEVGNIGALRKIRYR